jgi:hypothetical protein
VEEGGEEKLEEEGEETKEAEEDEDREELEEAKEDEDEDKDKELVDECGNGLAADEGKKEGDEKDSDFLDLTEDGVKKEVEREDEEKEKDVEEADVEEATNGSGAVDEEDGGTLFTCKMMLEFGMNLETCGNNNSLLAEERNMVEVERHGVCDGVYEEGEKELEGRGSGMDVGE